MNSPKNKYLITVVGPTAIGKTAMAIRIAEHFNTVVLSADSRQFYKEMSIGTAVPSADELSAVPHHFIQHRSIFEDYSVGDFEREALSLLEELYKTGDIVVMAGGSGLYVNAILKGLDDFPDVNPAIRQELNERLGKEGIRNLAEQLLALDPVYYRQADTENPQRVIRALEICLGTNKPYSSFLSGKSKKRGFYPITIGLTAEREIIYNRINRRVDIMMDNGLLREVESLFRYRQKNALQTVGYKELFEYLEGNCSLEHAISEIKKNTRRFAKRQLTWFRKQEGITWYDHEQDVSDILKSLSSRIYGK
ncbi:tRNA (adenosine(37)-N6)-dimethylallyltransferase MiaA [Sinomicrobium pectinilyticum]|uniref:tRNA dimethylallyltransferase n=1 Tax=Sinomicrobium pectinilyticum TaxID=1084421 RepID=A0A3N0E300_SINP1|nr:tRNA (adenosine(37)-N6)-dimethylallyltransferase MiaA [Sinomicrobium pectinilyticum]RNL82163.1 tRNA (adenosine(37)-N6)-dimethylallyltransferase MiaA [Sinomicrobium pectinilyticum]